MTQALVEPAPRPRRLWLRSLTSRLVAGVVALVIVVVAAIGSSTYYFLRSYLLNRLDQQVVSSAQQNSAFIDRCLVVGCRYSPPPVHEWIAVLNQPSGVEISINVANISNLALPPTVRTSLMRNPSQTLTVTTGDQELRVNGQSGRTGLVVVTGLSTRDVETTLRRLITLEVVIGASALTLAVILTSWGVRRGLRNLYAVTGTAQEVAAELSPDGAGLDRRVPVVEEGTEVGQLAESMNTLLAAVETQFAARLESEQRMRQFLADASHELRTPLTSIRGFAELARMQRASGVDVAADSADNLGRIESEGTRMSRLVDDLLLLARGDADGEIHAAERDWVDVGDLLDDAVSSSRAAFPDRRIDVEIGPTPAVLGDRDQLLRVVRNLVTNAAVHTQAGRPIAVRGGSDAGGAVISVADGGPGLPPDQAAHVFERFWRADKARTRARGGSGLGLAIVAAVVRAHGGSVDFRSNVESGSTVTVWLPAGSL